MIKNLLQKLKKNKRNKQSTDMLLDCKILEEHHERLRRVFNVKISDIVNQLLYTDDNKYSLENIKKILRFCDDIMIFIGNNSETYKKVKEELKK